LGQIAYRQATGEIIEAFAVDADEWAKMCAEPLGTYIMPETHWPALLKVSIRGLRFFAHASGYKGEKPKNESYAHTRLKIDVVKAARELGYKADLEVCGESPDGFKWRADVMVTDHNGQQTAFEIQMSSQTLAEYRRRTERYTLSGVRCCWVLMYKLGSSRLHHLEHAIHCENQDFCKETGLVQIEDDRLVTLRVMLEGTDTYPEKRPTLFLRQHFPIEQLQMPEAIDRVVQNKLHWARPRWRWT